MKNQSRIGGFHAIDAALEHTADKIVRVWVDKQRRDKRLSEFCQRVEALGLALETVDRKFLDSSMGASNHQGIVAELRIPGEETEKDLYKAIKMLKVTPFYLVLDQIQDPHNLGACLRTADAVGIQGVVIPKDKAVGITPTVYKVASGAVESVPVYRVANLARTMRQMKQLGLWLAGTDGGAEQEVYTADLSGPLALVIGAEDRGLRRLTREQCDFLVRLPLLGTVESLNLSVAAGAILYEAIRQRRLNNTTIG